MTENMRECFPEFELLTALSSSFGERMGDHNNAMEGGTGAKPSEWLISSGMSPRWRYLLYYLGLTFNSKRGNVQRTYAKLSEPSTHNCF